MRAPAFKSALAQHGIEGLVRAKTTTLQVNVGKRCNQACRHCHVDAGPNRTEAMDHKTADRLLWLLERTPTIDTVDITGGAPELSDVFRPLVQGATGLGRRVLDRCNLTVLLEPGQEDTADFLAAQRVEIIASLPCYAKDNVDLQRGKGVYERSMQALQHLNRLGYGQPDSGLYLNLVFNPVGPTLPGAQLELEAAYKDQLASTHGITFNRLFTLTNMPIARFARDLRNHGTNQAYMRLLTESFNPSTIDGLMCRSTVSIGYDGLLYDCDFNQMLDLPLAGRQRSIWDLDNLAQLTGENIETADHCLGCTAGSGSSCGGALA